MLDAASRRLPPHCRLAQVEGKHAFDTRPCLVGSARSRTVAHHRHMCTPVLPMGFQADDGTRLPLTSTLAQSVRGSTPHCSRHPTSICLVLKGSSQNLQNAMERPSRHCKA